MALKQWSLWMGCVAAATLVACGGGGSSTPSAQAEVKESTNTATDVKVSIAFGAVNGTTPVACGTQLTGLGTTAVAADIKDLRFYISNLSLLTDKGVVVPVKLDSNAWQLTQGSDTVALIDLEDASGTCNTTSNTTAKNAVVTGTVPAGTYVGLKASMGVPSTLNHSAITGGLAPLDGAAMAWSWQSGRKFAKIELNPVDGVTQTTTTNGTTTTKKIDTFNFHLGSTGCKASVDTSGVAIKDAAGNPTYTCTNPNVMDFSLASFNASTQKVVLDVGHLFSDSNIQAETGGAAGCMSGATDPECAVMFDKLKINFGSNSDGLSINGGAGQMLFKAVSQ